jgi:Tfp pilus assembly pilus retraction ATPase PilT
MLNEVCGSDNWELFEQHGDLDFAYQMDEHSRFRSNYFKQSEGYAAAFRLIPTKISTLEELGIPAVVKKFADLRGGLVLVAAETLPCESFEVAVPLRVYGAVCNGLERLERDEAESGLAV